MADAGFTLFLKTHEAQAMTKEVTLEELDAVMKAIARDAAALSPKSLTGSHHHPPGYNAASIRYMSRAYPNGIGGKVWTESGYGGYIEVGGRHREAHPYIYPAAATHLPTLADKIRVQLQGGSSKKRGGQSTSSLMKAALEAHNLLGAP